ncbi:MAG: S46 family peptidase [Flavobacteriales bacterium]
MKLTRRTLLFLLIFIKTLSLSATEGMWLPLLIKALKEKDMQTMGMKLTAEDLYSINKSSIKDAIVHFGGGCTAEVVSYEGLIFTNHHCGYGEIQNHSTVTNNYLRDGFWAMSKKEELKNPGLTATFIVRIEDVTQAVTDGINPDMDLGSRSRRMAENIKKIKSKAVVGTHYEADVKSFFYGNEYYLFVTETFKDVRLVGAPPSCIGKFGGDTDNWVWPRHTGDFSVFRIYAGKDNKPADVSDDNVPYRPRYSLPISMQTLQENDFTMVYGFPGRTTQHLSSEQVKYIIDVSNPAKIKMREASLAIIDNAMKSSEALRIMYAAKQSRISNAYKKWIGANIGLKENNATQAKLRFEEEFTKRAKAANKYTTTLDKVKKQQLVLEKIEFPVEMFYEYFHYGPEALRFASGFQNLIENTAQLISDTLFEDELNTKINGAKGFFKNYDVAIDRLLFERLTTMYLYIIKDPVYGLNIAEVGFPKKISQASIPTLTNYIYNTTVFADQKKFEMAFKDFNPKKALKLQKDPAYLLGKYLDEKFKFILRPEYTVEYVNMENLMAEYMQAQVELFPEKIFSSDANSSLRITYGKTEGSAPRDGMKYTWYTTIDGIMQKYNFGIEDFELNKKFIEAYNRKDWGPYAQEGELRVCFTGSNHTTGGNSGSPALNAYGHLIGINFDRSWESTMSDVMFDPSRCRNIMVDVKYVLWVIDKYAGAGHLIKEMNLVTDETMHQERIKGLKEQERRYNEMLKDVPNEANYYFHRALIRKELGLKIEMMEDLEWAVKYDTKNKNYQLKLIHEQALTGNVKRVNELVAQLGRLGLNDAQRSEVLFAQAKVYFQINDNKRALSLATESISANPIFAEAYELRARIYKAMGNENAAKLNSEMAQKLRA